VFCASYLRKPFRGRSRPGGVHDHKIRSGDSVGAQQQRLGARGKVTLRNDSTHPQKIVVLQISASLNWRSIRVDGKAVQYVSQPYQSDIDHTGALAEAIVTLPPRSSQRAP